MLHESKRAASAICSLQWKCFHSWSRLSVDCHHRLTDKQRNSSGPTCSGTLSRMSKRNFIFISAGLLLLAMLILQIPAVNSRLTWRYEVAKTYARNVLNPVDDAPTAIPNTPAPAGVASPTSQATPSSEVTATPIPPTLVPPPLYDVRTIGLPEKRRSTWSVPGQPKTKWF